MAVLVLAAGAEAGLIALATAATGVLREILFACAVLNAALLLFMLLVTVVGILQALVGDLDGSASAGPGGGAEGLPGSDIGGFL